MKRPTIRLKFATYNIHRCIGADGKRDTARVAAVIRELDADVVALQEVQIGDHHTLDMLDTLVQHTDSVPIAGPTMQFDTGHFGNALLTRLPILGVKHHDLSFTGREPRGAIDVRFHYEDHCLHVVATHLGMLPVERRTQIQRLLPLFEDDSDDLQVMLGDINEWLLWGRPLRWMHRQFAHCPHRRTFPARWPILPLDRIWLKPSGIEKRYQVHKSPLSRLASDHLPLTLTVSL